MFATFDFRSWLVSQIALETYQFGGTVYNASFVRVVLKDMVHHHFQVVGLPRGLWDHFVVKVLPIQRGGEVHRFPRFCHYKWFSVSADSGDFVTHLSPVFLEAGPGS